jgi:hypothetical protein
MRGFLREQLEQFLKAVDTALVHPVEIIVIGGSAAALHYGVDVATRDIDTWTNVEAALATAADRARSATGLDVPIQRSGVADAPVDFESRLERYSATARIFALRESCVLRPGGGGTRFVLGRSMPGPSVSLVS